MKKVNPQSTIQPTEKPVKLAVRAMQYSSRSGENVLDLFGGSGSTPAAGRLRRSAIQSWQALGHSRQERLPLTLTLGEDSNP